MPVQNKMLGYLSDYCERVSYLLKAVITHTKIKLIYLQQIDSFCIASFLLFKVAVFVQYRCNSCGQRICVSGYFTLKHIKVGYRYPKYNFKDIKMRK